MYKLLGFAIQDRTEALLVIQSQETRREKGDLKLEVGKSHHFILKEKNAGSASQAEERAGPNLRGRDKGSPGDITGGAWFKADGRVNR